MTKWFSSPFFLLCLHIYMTYSFLPMHPLFNLPYEIHHTIFTHLPQSTLAQLCLIDHQSYILCLPHLYRHVHISIRRQTIQLEKGLRRSSLLRQVVENHTKHLTLTTSQSGFQWLISNAHADWCRRWMPNLLTLTFCDFTILPVERISLFLTCLASLQYLSLQYCNLVCLDQPEAFIPMVPDDHYLLGIYQLPASYHYHQHSTSNNNDDVIFTTTFTRPRSIVSCLRLDWTDFSPTAINNLLHNLPGLTRVFFGANHNRIPNANTAALKALKQHCPLISVLKIALQQVHPPTVRQLITHYGPQLLQLDIQCHDTATLKTVAQHAKMIEWLVIHAVGTLRRQQVDNGDGDDWIISGVKENDDDYDGNNSSSSSSPPLSRTSTATTHTNNRDQLELDGIERIVQQCHQLIRMDMVRWGFCATPLVILLVMAHRQKQQQHQHHKQRPPRFLFANNGPGVSFPTTTRMGLIWDSSIATIHLDSPILLTPVSTWSEKTSLALDRKTLADIRNLFT